MYWNKQKGGYNKPYEPNAQQQKTISKNESNQWKPENPGL